MELDYTEDSLFMPIGDGKIWSTHNQHFIKNLNLLQLWIVKNKYHFRWVPENGEMNYVLRWISISLYPSKYFKNVLEYLGTLQNI